MPIKIHYGPPGSYKTSGALGDDFLREARAGRVVVTNVRGLNKARVLDEFPDLPETFDVIHVDDKTAEGRDKWAKWFHWAPKGAFLFVDEIQDIWPKRWRDADIKVLDYPGGVEKAGLDDRPYCWDQAFDKHRHWNWDMVLTTPSYKKVRDDVKGCADMAYKHKDLTLIGWTGCYIEACHLADDDGKAQGDFLNIQKKKVPSYVFKLYDSTATGAHSQTRSGFNIFASPRVLVLLVVLALSLYFGFRNGTSILPSHAVKPAGSESVPAGAGVGSSPSSKTGGVAGADMGLGKSDADDLKPPFSGDGVFIAMSVKTGAGWRYLVSFANTEFTETQILDMGYIVRSAGACGVYLIKDQWQRLITCGFTKDQADRRVVQSPTEKATERSAKRSEEPFAFVPPSSPAG